MPQAVGDKVPRGGRSGEPKARTGGAAGSPPGRFAPGAEGDKRALLFLGFPPPEALKAFFKVKKRARVTFLQTSAIIEFSVGSGG
ncbi:hypothetical protein AFERRI_580014 [Acidithiobacillus ferrivorans]|uniref:Uncharacterized protein n=2 Tax=Acidithiobacillus ferrivorans TaxID=160808 RepID=A0A060UTM9_9PROT|nr:hypothetical protein AFERRI_520005 [Acidithiobacillus ferrivorans]CDQ11681.1 hypothetical protein AFERRI_580014 [Acidithiobacillus ferrivorans]